MFRPTPDALTQRDDVSHMITEVSAKEVLLFVYPELSIYATNHFNHYPTMSKSAVLLATLEKVPTTFPDWYCFTSTGGCLGHNLSFGPS